MGGKIEIKNKTPVTGRADLSRVYTPGVARVCLAIEREPEAAWTLTVKKNTVAVVTDGTAVLGLGDIGPTVAAMPVMEGKAMLFKEFGGVDAWPICLDTKDPEEIIKTVKYLAPGFGGINLEDISAPRCFEIEERLKKELDIPVFPRRSARHRCCRAGGAAQRAQDRQEGDGRPQGRHQRRWRRRHRVREDLLLCRVSRMIIGCDSRGAIYKGRKEGMNPIKEWFAENTNSQNGLTGSLKDAMEGADLFLGVSGPDIVTGDDIKKMNKDPIVFALANPDPEIRPEAGAAARARDGNRPL